MELDKTMKKAKKSLLVLTSLGMVTGGYVHELNNLKVVHAAKNYEGGCQVETKTGEITINAKSTTVETVKPVDLLMIADGSGSIDAQYMYIIIHMSKALVDSLPDGSRVMIATYARNETDSYQGRPTRMLTKAEAQNFFDDIIAKTGDSLLAYNYDTVRDQISNYALSTGVTSGPYEDIFAKHLKQGNTPSVIQLTDGWDDGEDIDRSFAAWSKANAKTFMSVLVNGKTGTSHDKMLEVGHPNIYATGQAVDTIQNLSKINQEIIAQFRDTATEKVTSKGHIQVNAPQGVTLKEVKLVAPDGVEETLPITSNQVDIEKELPKDGNYKVKVKADGLVHENSKVTMSATVGGGQPVTGEILFEACKDDVKATKEEKENVDIPFNTLYEDTDELPAGETRVKREGVVGIKEIKRVWNTVNGVKQGDPTVTESIIKPKVDKIILRGTQQKKTVYYRIVDPSDKVLKDNTKVSDGYKGSKYTVTKPTLAGYEIELKPGMKESGTLEGRDVIVDYVAYKLGKGVNARFVDEDGKELKAGVKVKDAGLRNGTKYGVAPEPVLEKDGLKYVYNTLGRGSAPANGVINDNEQVVTFVYKKAEGGSVKARYLNKDTVTSLIDDLIIKPKGTQVGTPWVSTHKDELVKDGLFYTFDGKAPVESGKVTDKDQILTYNYVPKLGKNIRAEFVKKDTADKLIDDLIIKPDGTQVGTPWTSSHKNELMKDGLVYAIVGTLPVELGKVTEKEQVLKYNYVPKVGQPVRVRYVADNVEISGMEVVSENAQVGSGYEKEVAHEIKKDGKLYRFVGLEKVEEGMKPKADEPKVDEPKGDELKVDTPKGNEPKGEKPTDGKPDGVKPNEDSKPKDSEAPKADAPKVDEPKATDGDVIEVDSKSEIKDRQFKGIVNNHEQVYVAKYVEVKPAPVKVNFVDENGKELKAGVNLLKADTLLDSDYKYDAEKRIKVGDDEYALVGVTLDGKDVKEIKGKFGEKEQVYTAKYKKVVKPAPAKLPKTSGVEGYAKTQVATGLTVMGILGLILSFFGYRRKVNK
jgi:hypothetical protein